MDIIKRISIENFRSLRSLNIDLVSDYNSIVGLNSSGKSNILRALNLFFNDSIDPSSLNLGMERDFSDYAPRRKKKVISVGVELNLSGDIKVPRQNDFLSSNTIEETLAINRSWSLDPQGRIIDEYRFGPSLDSLELAAASQVGNLHLFIRSIQFRYIPNHTQPADLIRTFAQPLRSELIRRLQATQEYRQLNFGTIMAALARTGTQMFSEVSDSVSEAIRDLTIDSALPEDFGELAFEVAIKSVSNGIGRSPDLEGSGTQSFILLHFLNLIDRVSRQRAFGWVQASIWAMEEPESFLHSGLRAKFAADLDAYAKESRRQVFVTTHQDEFVRVADSAWLAFQDRNGTQIDRASSREILEKSTRLAITTYRHPLLEYPDVPIVIVEGKYDHLYLAAASREADLRPRWKIISPNDYLGEGSAGDALKQYLKFNKAALGARPYSAPILVLRDWEVTDVAGYQKFVKVHPYSDAAVTPVDLVNPALDESFVGIERYLETDRILDVVSKKDLMCPASGEIVYGIAKSKLDGYKKLLSEKVISGEPAGKFLIDLVRWLDEQVMLLLQSVPVERYSL